MIHAQLPLRVPCYDFFHVTDSTLTPHETKFQVSPAPLK